MFQKLENESLLGYKLHDLGDRWELHWSGGIFRGNMKQVVVFAVLELGFEIGELELGIIEMEKNFHNGAEYGIMKRFIYTFERDEHKTMAC